MDHNPLKPSQATTQWTISTSKTTGTALKILMECWSPSGTTLSWSMRTLLSWRIYGLTYWLCFSLIDQTNWPYLRLSITRPSVIWSSKTHWSVKSSRHAKNTKTQGMQRLTQRSTWREYMVLGRTVAYLKILTRSTCTTTLSQSLWRTFLSTFTMISQLKFRLLWRISENGDYAIQPVQLFRMRLLII